MTIPGFMKVLFQGFPGRADRGYLGWSSVILVLSPTKMLFDTGNWGDREELIARLSLEGLGPEDIERIIVSHLHFDHCMNLSLFPRAEIVVSKKSLDYISRVHNDPFVPEYMASYLRSISDRVHVVEGDTKLDETVALLETPGHTPGCMSCVITGKEGYVALAGDAIKNAYDYVAGVAEMSQDQEASRRTIEKIREIADVIVPGHDRPFRFEGGRVIYLSDAVYGIKARTNPYAPSWTTFTIGLCDATAPTE